MNEQQNQQLQNETTSSVPAPTASSVPANTQNQGVDQNYLQVVSQMPSLGAPPQGDYDEIEMAAGGELDSINPSKIFDYRMLVTPGELGEYAIKRQSDDKIIWHGSSFDGIMLHGHPVFKLSQWIVDGLYEQPGFNKKDLTNEQSQVLAITYDTPKKSRGSFDVAGLGAWLNKPELFNPVKRYSRQFIYFLMPGLKDPDTGKFVGIIYASLPISGASAYNHLVLQRKSKGAVLPYRITKFSLVDAESENGDKYKKTQFTLGNNDYAPLGDLHSPEPGTLRATIRPHVEQMLELHKNLVENTEAGLIIKDVDANEVEEGEMVGMTIPDEPMTDEHGNPLF